MDEQREETGGVPDEEVKPLASTLPAPPMPNEQPLKKKCGFALLSAERRREIASIGGTAVHAQGKAYAFTRETARAAGQKGGFAVHARRGRQKKPKDST